ncbi:unnamed protein product [Clonostachys rosea]|uniref:Uncharacterized protein n=1 Tax=Bionectria ochroleuca TaxID=29856 RepID=A0ABY6V2T9_BIOOC|nr:unnamed protein product [Clonostachys rosea]
MSDGRALTSNDGPNVRLLASFPHCGSSLLDTILTKSSVCTVKGSPATVEDDEAAAREKHTDSSQFQVYRNEYGPDALGDEGLVRALESAALRPALLVRDPVRVLDNCDGEAIQEGYARYCKMVSQSASTHIVLHERLLLDRSAEITRLCDWWGMPFSESMMRMDDRTAITFERDGGKYRNCLSNARKDQVEEAIGRQYLRCWKNEEFLQLQTLLSEKSWFGFDLDDTLHEFRRASGAAVDAVLRAISDHTGAGISLLKETHSQVLKEKTANAFSDGKTSFDYRRERFIAVLSRLSLPSDDETFLMSLLQVYEATLTKSFELKAGALQLFETLKRLGKKIVVITEGPQDAQERTVEALGLAKYIDFLATTNHFRVSKTSGIFGKVLDHLDISPGDMVFVGDNEERDVRMATAAGIFSIYYSEALDVSLTVDGPRINTLRKLQYLLEGGDTE